MKCVLRVLEKSEVSLQRRKHDVQPDETVEGSMVELSHEQDMCLVHRDLFEKIVEVKAVMCFWIVSGEEEICVLDRYKCSRIRLQLL